MDFWYFLVSKKTILEHIVEPDRHMQRNGRSLLYSEGSPAVFLTSTMSGTLTFRDSLKSRRLILIEFIKCFSDFKDLLTSFNTQARCLIGAG